MKAYRDADLFMVDIECIVCQTVISALPSNGNDGTVNETFHQDIEAEILSQKGRELLTVVSNIENDLFYKQNFKYKTKVVKNTDRILTD